MKKFYFKNWIVLTSISVFILTSCSQESNEKETITDEKFGKHNASELNAKDSIQSEKKDSIIGFDALSDTLKLKNGLESLVAEYNARPLRKSTILGRFSNVRSEQVELIGKNKVPYGKEVMLYPKAEIYMFEYNDSAQVITTLYNWMDCFGSDCEALKLLKDVKHIKMPPSFVVLGDNKILWLKYPSEHKANDYTPVKNALRAMIPEDKRYYEIDVDAGGPLKWKGFTAEADSLYQVINQEEED